MSDEKTTSAAAQRSSLAGYRGDKRDPYRYVCRDGLTTIEFPDPSRMDMLEAEEFMQSLQRDPDSKALLKWLGPEQYDRLLEEKWTLGEKNFILRDHVFAHYQDIFGRPGN